ncbi:MAG: hypothetical protein ACQEQ4_06245 [Fibrobacterota bacterium]
MNTTDPLHNNAGVTLVELIVYMVVSLFVIAFSLELLTSLFTGAEHERRVVNIQHDGTELITILARDVSTMGFKHYLVDTATHPQEMVYTTRQIPGTWIGSFQDSTGDESFRFNPAGTPGFLDTLTLYRGVMDDVYTPDRVERVVYEVNDDTLFRILTPLDPTFDITGTGSPDYAADWGDADTVALAQGVQAFKFEFSPDFQDWYSDPAGMEEDISYIRIALLLRSEREGKVQNSRDFVFLEYSGDTTSIAFTPSAGNRNIYRKYETVIEVPSNGQVNF